MRAHEFIPEAFDTTLPVQWQNSPYPNGLETTATFTDPAGRPGLVRFTAHTNVGGFQNLDIMFEIDRSTGRVPAQGGEQQIFSTVINSIRKYLNSHKPDVITFSAQGDDRAQLYNRMVQRELARIPGYDNRSDIHQGGGSFLLTKKGYLDRMPTPVNLTDPTEPFTPRHPPNRKSAGIKTPTALLTTTTPVQQTRIGGAGGGFTAPPTLDQPVDTRNMDLGADLDPKALVRRNQTR